MRAGMVLKNIKQARPLIFLLEFNRKTVAK
jgi:hypothetical protein